MNDSKRIPIKHLITLKPIEFVNLLSYIKKNYNSIISEKNCRISLKVDGFACKFGMTKEGKFFLETAHSGIKFEPNFSENFFKKYNKISPIMQMFDNVFIELSNNKDLIRYLKTFPKGIKIFTELLYIPIGKIEENNIRFITVKYNKNIFKNYNINFVILKVIDGNENNLKYSEIFFDLYMLNLKEIQFINSIIINWKEINISKEVNYVLNYIDNIKDFEYIIKSRKQCHKLFKQEIISTLKSYSEILTKKLNDNFNYKSNYEGIVFEFKNGQSFKVVSDYYINEKEKYESEFK